jgi:hypothetical protein
MKKITCIVVLAMSTLVIGAVPAHAGASVTRGELSPFAAALTTLNGQYGDIAGHAQMVRTADGKTIVTLHVTGLETDTTYPAHVHKHACADGDADGHYRFDPSGSATPPNEIWPGFTSNADGIGNGKATVDAVAGSTAISVVVHAPSGSKIGCADLA